VTTCNKMFTPFPAFCPSSSEQRRERNSHQFVSSYTSSVYKLSPWQMSSHLSVEICTCWVFILFYRLLNEFPWSQLHILQTSIITHFKGLHRMRQCCFCLKICHVIVVSDLWSTSVYPNFPDWVDNKRTNNKNKHSLRSNIKGYGGKTH